MKGEDTTKEGLETLERVLGTGGAGKASEGGEMPQEEPKKPDGAEADGTGTDSGEKGSAAVPSEAEKPDAPLSPKKGTPVFVYLAVMFAAAFLMLLLAYFIQERNSAVQIGNLQSAMESFQSIDDLMEENRQLRSELKALRDDYDSLSQELEDTQRQLEGTQEAMDGLARSAIAAQNMFLLENLMREERYEEAAAVLNSMLGSMDINTQLQMRTPEAEDVGFRGEERLQEIIGQLEALGYTIQARQATAGTGSSIGNISR